MQFWLNAISFFHEMGQLMATLSVTKINLTTRWISFENKLHVWI